MLTGAFARAVSILILTVSILLPAAASEAGRSIVVAGASETDRRTALVVGNGDYESSPLKNPVNDAQDMARSLEGLGFDVTTLINANHRQMEDAVRDFGRKLRQGGAGLFYYAGHGLQVGGVNYLVPLDARIEKESDVKFECLDANRVLAEMDEARNGLNIIILDACRDNPFARGFRSTSRGLAQMDAPSGTFIAFATAPGSVAADGDGRNGIFTQYLLSNMDKPGLKIEDVMKLTRNRVIQDTGSRQVPWQSSSLTGDFYFVADTPARDATPSPPELDRTPLPKPASPGGIPDYDSVIDERAQAEDEWASWQKSMEDDFQKVLGYDRSDRLKAREKAGAWGSFLTVYASDNPFSINDNELRDQAEERQAYWRNQETQAHSSTPPATRVFEDSANPQRRVEGLVEKFIQVSNGNDLREVLSVYAGQVDFYGAGVVGHDFIWKDKENYYKSWPERKYSLAGPLTIEEARSPDRFRVSFTVTFDLRNPRKGNLAYGAADMTLTLRQEEDILKISGIKEKILNIKKDKF